MKTDFSKLYVPTNSEPVLVASMHVAYDWVVRECPQQVRIMRQRGCGSGESYDIFV